MEASQARLNHSLLPLTKNCIADWHRVVEVVVRAVAARHAAHGFCCVLLKPACDVFGSSGRVGYLLLCLLLSDDALTYPVRDAERRVGRSMRLSCE